MPPTRAQVRSYLAGRLSAHMGKTIADADFGADVTLDSNHILVGDPVVVRDAEGQPVYRRWHSISIDKLTDVLIARAVSATNRQAIVDVLSDDTVLGPWLRDNL